MATETQTPIEAIESLIFIADPITGDGRKIVDDARAALEDVEALVTAAERVRYLTDEGEEQMKTAAWTIAWTDGAGALRTAVAKFTVKS